MRQVRCCGWCPVPDIAMCQNQDCPSRNECWRFRAVPSYRQSYGTWFKPADGKDRCDDFWPIEDRPVVPIAELSGKGMEAVPEPDTLA